MGVTPGFTSRVLPAVLKKKKKKKYIPVRGRDNAVLITLSPSSS